MDRGHASLGRLVATGSAYLYLHKSEESDTPIQARFREVDRVRV